MRERLEAKLTVPDNVPLHQATRGWLTLALHAHQKDLTHLWPPELPANHQKSKRTQHIRFCHTANADKRKLCVFYLRQSDRATIELGDALIGLVASLPHPIILKGKMVLTKSFKTEVDAGIGWMMWAVKAVRQDAFAPSESKCGNFWVALISFPGFFSKYLEFYFVKLLLSMYNCIH